jgi:quercetin dioxygenase-like cupin family protein
MSRSYPPSTTSDSIGRPAGSFHSAVNQPVGGTRCAKIFEPGEGIRTIDLAGTTVTSKADGTTTGDAFVVAETTLAPGGFEPPLHLHREIAESLYVLDGRLDLQVGDDRRIAVPGTFVSIPAGVPHTMSVAGTEPVRMLMVLSNPARSTPDVRGHGAGVR